MEFKSRDELLNHARLLEDGTINKALEILLTIIVIFFLILLTLQI